MLFHITAQHDHTTCPRVLQGSEGLRPGTAWVEGSDTAKVIGAWGYPVSHRSFAVVEADTFEDVAALFENHLGMGPVEVIPVHDNVQRRKDMGLWGER
ncbi:MAG: DUF3303 family protein [Chloroflexota bacterium]|uniref:YCII-related domain-containing protein n=1 Tax=marine metagenome TaxID=408172 RepID=A0A381VHP3_9ZZZZ|nr:DUF3303 family protein [Chloroflexota bacterium]|tara:strand:- start:1084 stop:1377 length:294 start_codon:yes stop_codon:yes gene_type:complete